MTTVIGAILAFIFLDGPWRYLLIVLLLVIDFFQILIWLRWRQRRSITGHEERLVGARGTAMTDCDLDGQVRVRGQMWKAHASESIQAGDQVVVTAVDGLVLEVAPHTSSPSTVSQ